MAAGLRSGHSGCSSNVAFRQQNKKKGKDPDGFCWSPQTDVHREQGVKPGVRMGWGRQADLSAALARCSAAFPPNTEVPHAHAHLARRPERHRTPVHQGPSHTHPPYRPAPATIPDEPHSTPHLTTTSNQPPLGKSAPAIARRCLKVGLLTQSPERGAWVATRPQTPPPHLDHLSPAAPLIRQRQLYSQPGRDG